MNIANTHCLDAAARYSFWLHDVESGDDEPPVCHLSGRTTPMRLPAAVSIRLGSMGLLAGSTFVDMQIGWVSRPAAVVAGTVFNAGEPLVGVLRKGWTNRRCSSVFTAVVGGVSRYGVIKKFIQKADGSGEPFAIVEWLPIPTYPYAHPLIVCIRDGDRVGDLPIVLAIECIDPCNVCVERCDVESCYYMYRLEGLDTI